MASPIPMKNTYQHHCLNICFDGSCPSASSPTNANNHDVPSNINPMNLNTSCVGSVTRFPRYNRTFTSQICLVGPMPIFSWRLENHFLLPQNTVAGRLHCPTVSVNAHTPWAARSHEHPGKRNPPCCRHTLYTHHQSSHERNHRSQQDNPRRLTISRIILLSLSSHMHITYRPGWSLVNPLRRLANQFQEHQHTPATPS
ncbi:unnamed protein product [Schistocephalus solidus]|uniref:Uncharacterized protein n=1 Tax=Schistocephalus solidus TaxID=70667 RepID=A0A183STA5_SCHSO|nr:unnamed protein product [Schistocephalus solidus]